MHNVWLTFFSRHNSRGLPQHAASRSRRRSAAGMAANTETLECRALLSGLSPVVAQDSYNANEDEWLVVSAGLGVLSNDSDPESDPLTAVIESWPYWGSLQLAEDGSFTYLPSPNYFGNDTFTYRANDGTSDSSPINVFISIADIYNLPRTVPDTYWTLEDFPLGPEYFNVLRNDIRGDGGPLTAVLVSTTTHGVLDLHADGTFLYTPAPDFYGEDSFTYRANDGTVDSVGVASVTITIAPSDEQPVITSSADRLSVTGKHAVFVDPDAILTDADSTNFSGGSMTAGVYSGPGINDLLGFQSHGAKRGLVNARHGELRIGKLVIGTVSGGRNQWQLDVTFNSEATLDRVQSVVRSLIFKNKSKVAGPREIQYVVVDDQGLQSTGSSRFIDATWE